MPLVNTSMLNRKRKKEYKPPEYGTYRHAAMMGVKDPREFYRMRLERSIQKKMNHKCDLCDKKARYIGRKFLKLVYFCEEHKNEAIKNGE